jgi:hypothetical protein
MDSTIFYPYLVEGFLSSIAKGCYATPLALTRNYYDNDHDIYYENTSYIR